MKRTAVHIRSGAYPERSLCGLSWPVRGGEPASDTTPPVVRDEAGSVNAATCRTCVACWRRIEALKRRQR